MFKSAEEREAARREREAEEAREKASRAELAREAEEERRREEFLATPYGAAKAAMDAGEAFFEIQLIVGGHVGTAEPGGLLTRELLWAVRTVACELDLCCMDMVEVSPPYDHAAVTAMAAQRVVLETLGGIALRRSGRAARPERP